jgi:hypothetical protein
VQATFPAYQRSLEDSLIVGSVVAGRQETLGILEGVIVGTGTDLRILREVLTTFANMRWKASKEVSTIDLEWVECEEIVD